jgi:hypothetical protein
MRKHGKRGRKASAKTVRSSTADSSRSRGKPSAASRPCYDRKHRELRVGSIVVKWFTQASDAQEIVLTAFQEQRWPRTIDDPLPGKEGQERKQRLRTAVANLKRRQRVPMLRFRVLRQGTAIAWEFRQASDSRAT